ncbi:uncharacterized protein B0P05DRAFT_641410 [Gilbertella persicaria]|uniref:uncharacterized protein n=1 Tax=Gilbertella persicaria TaxID=101096 RepID=UPI00222039BE|nr:uncharacterized protein B0P05DRAFT_641410 [Gilbertella persicaria]KAI8053694.1 hypothetical protein B0P05DRAFT_641410 [Gilbertella persicaria]
MKLSTASLLVFVALCASSVSASPFTEDIAALEVQNVERSVNDTPLLVKRTNFCPCKTNDALIHSLMGSIKADLNVRVFSLISSTFSEKAFDSLNIASILLGSYELSDASLKLIESSFAATLKSTFSATLNAQINAKIFAILESSLRKKCGSKTLTDAQLIAILAEIYAEANILIKTQLPKIGSTLQTKAGGCVSSGITTIKKKIPGKGKAKGKSRGKARAKGLKSAKLNAALAANFSAKSTVNASIDKGLKGCNNWNHQALAKKIVLTL